MHTVHVHVNRVPHALVQVGPYQTMIELPGHLRVGDPQYTAELSKAIAAGLEAAFETSPPRASV